MPPEIIAQLDGECGFQGLVIERDKESVLKKTSKRESDEHPESDTVRSRQVTLTLAGT